MDRKEFIEKAGIGAFVALVIGACVACTRMDNPIPPVSSIDKPEPLDVDFTIDLTDPSHLSLQTNGEWVEVEIDGKRYVVARAVNGDYIAATRLCSHEAYFDIEYFPTQNEWVCVEHGAGFDLNGNGTITFEGPPANVDPSFNDNGLDVYNTELIGASILRVYS
jgi:nitrite reductase/ring-hydroxylating ferredoxin subunit